MASEVDDLLAQTKLLENSPHGRLVGVDPFLGFWIVLIKVGNEDEELPEAPFFKQPHQTFGK